MMLVFVYFLALVYIWIVPNNLARILDCSQFKVLAADSMINPYQSSFILSSKVVPKDKSFIYVSLSSGIQQGKDFTVKQYTALETVITEHLLNSTGQSEIQLITLLLKRGKTWFPNVNSTTSLYVLSAHACAAEVANSSSLLSRATLEKTCVGIIERDKYKRDCSHIPKFPGLSLEMGAFIQVVVRACQAPKIIPSKQLRWGDYTSLDLIHLNPRVMFIDGTDQPVMRAAHSVDRFLAAHAFLTISWEPYAESDPSWWVLIPKPLGTPGFHYIMLDELQWRHPIVQNASVYAKMVSCVGRPAVDSNTCTVGCANTMLRGFQYGFGASMLFMGMGILQALALNIPIQAVPSMYRRVTGKRQRVRKGWIYLDDQCRTNFLDCVFLDHSPCPHVKSTLDNTKDFSKENYQRLRMGPRGYENQSQIMELPPSPIWTKLFSAEVATDKVPENTLVHSVDDNMDDLRSFKIAANYISRPNYRLRRKLYHEVLHQNELMGGSFFSRECAHVNVRRGDVLLDPGKARPYIHIKDYIAAVRPILQMMNISTVFLTTDDQSAVDESHRCAVEFPHICGGLVFHYVHRPRHHMASTSTGFDIGSFFPSNSSSSEFLSIQLDLALTKHCTVSVQASGLELPNSFANLLLYGMCDGTPIQPRGTLPHRSLCPMQVNIEPYNWTQPSVDYYSTEEEIQEFLGSGKAFADKFYVSFQSPYSDPERFRLDKLADSNRLTKYLDNHRKAMCGDYDKAPAKPRLCLH